MLSGDFRVKLFAGSIIMVVLQLFLAPIISINAVIPNFLLAYMVACIVARPDTNHLVFAFAMGVFFDIFTSGPVGAMSFVMVIISFFVSIILRRIENVNLAISIITIILAIFCSELIYGVFQMSIFVDQSFIDILAFRVLPCALYDVILGIIMFPIVLRYLAPAVTTGNFNEEIDNTR